MWFAGFLLLVAAKKFPNVPKFFFFFPKFLYHRWAVNFWAEGWEPEDPNFTLALTPMRNLAVAHNAFTTNGLTWAGS